VDQNVHEILGSRGVAAKEARDFKGELQVGDVAAEQIHEVDVNKFAGSGLTKSWMFAENQKEKHQKKTAFGFTERLITNEGIFTMTQKLRISVEASEW
jgi:hypothetical protein